METSPLIAHAQRIYRLLITAASKLQSPLLLVLRLFIGWQFFLAGKGKLTDLAKPTE